MEPKKVSIILCSYNHSSFVIEALDSIKNQSYLNIELIIVDDFSKDNSTELIDLWLNEHNYYAKTFFFKANNGLSFCLNFVLNSISGEFVKIISADDKLHYDSIKRCVEDLEFKGPKFGLVFTNSWTILSDSKITENIFDHSAFQNFSKEEFRKLLIQDNRIPALTVLMRKEALIETGKYDETFLVEDYSRWLRINEKYWISYIPDKLSYYRLHENNVSGERDYIVKEEILMLKIIHDKFQLNRKYINSEIKKRIRYNQISDRLFVCYSNYIHRNRFLVIILMLKKIINNKFK